ncbi:MAG TPA: ribosome biogenesis GTPase YlqF [Candidatus Borkfalkia excrementigallinarum]|uniref:Ribosome biogenesis GTPase A n=1 Tax=Candidatus Borkfalkia excrementigallinarum TaxID=2838506 RepID=A0A9D2CQQ7_9FIRM|nr:ribosome biogenesis GTPase YlqF [Candidatus Borkfalkia excrementigallinarum]
MKHIQWFPGHMTKAMRMMEESVKLVDGVLVVLDARAPAAALNKNLNKLFGTRPVLYILNKSDLADDSKTDAFLSEFSKAGLFAAKCCANAAGAAKQLSGRISVLLKEKFAKDEQKGIVRPPKLMVAGIPNTGKSTVINALSGAKRAVTGDKAGVTRGKQWIRCAGFELLDTPGTMPPSFDNQNLARHLAYIGSINDDILDMDDVALELLREIAETYPEQLTARYGIADFSSPLAMYEEVCRRRGFMLRGGEYDYARGANAIIDDFRKGRLGRITLDKPEDFASLLR